MGKQKHLLMKNKKYICLCWMKKIFKCRRQTSSSFASDQSWDDFIPSFYQILIQSHPPRNIFTSWNILFVLQNINVWLKIYFYQISPLLVQQCVGMWHTALCAECDANLIRNSEEICFQRHFYSARAWESSASSAQAVTTLSKQFSHNLLESKDFKDRFYIFCFDAIAWRWSRSSSVQCNCRSLCFGVSFHGSRLFAIFFARMCIDPVTS